jgi:hypothetical protein
MSSNISTPVAQSSDARALAGICWRLVEAQHHVSTLKLVDSVDEQRLLEDLIEAPSRRYLLSAGTSTTCCRRRSGTAGSRLVRDFGGRD